MPNTTSGDLENGRITLALLTSVERDGAQSQRRLASELGIALGLVNAYLKRCIRKGLVKVSEAPARRYAYYLTPQGFAEKSRLTIEYVTSSFSFFRKARADCAELLATARDRGWRSFALAGVSDLAEITRLCALDSGIDIVAIVDPRASALSYTGLTVFKDFESISAPCDGVVITDLLHARDTYAAAVAQFGAAAVLAPKLLGLEAETARETVQ